MVKRVRQELQMMSRTLEHCGMSGKENDLTMTYCIFAGNSGQNDWDRLPCAPLQLL
jgi:hypothetical protein